MPRAYIEMILSSKPVNRLCPLATILGSKLPCRSRGVSSSSSPKSPFSTLQPLPLRLFPLCCPAGSCFSYPRWSVSSTCSARSRIAFVSCFSRPFSPMMSSGFLYPASIWSISALSIAIGADSPLPMVGYTVPYTAPNRGVKDIFIACVDGLKGFPEAIEALYPQTEVQLCIVHLVRASLNYVPWKYRKLVAADLRGIYQSATAEEARQHLEEMMLKWTAYPSVGQVWQRNWDRITPFFHYPADIRKAIYTTNSVEALHRSLRKILKTRGAFPNQESALKLLFLAIRQASKKGTMPVKNWSEALNYFAVLWPERMARPGRLA